MSNKIMEETMGIVRLDAIREKARLEEESRELQYRVKSLEEALSFVLYDNGVETDEGDSKYDHWLGATLVQRLRGVVNLEEAVISANEWIDLETDEIFSTSEDIYRSFADWYTFKTGESG